MKNKAVLAICVILALVVFGYIFRSRFTGEKHVVIRMIGEAYAPLQALEEVKGEFEKKTGITVQVIQKDHQAVVAELDQELASRDVSYDLILMPHRLLGKLARKGNVQPIKPFLADTSLHNAEFNPEEQLFQEWWKEISWYDGQSYGFPFTCLTMYVCYRKDLVSEPAERARFKERFGRELAPPANWDEYLQLAEFFHRPKDGLYGTYIQGQQHISLWYEWLNFAYSFGGNILDSSHGSEIGDIVVNSPENKDATKLYLRLVEFSPPETKNYNWDDALASLQQGRVFMGILWHDQTPLLEDAKQSKVVGKMGYTLVPKNGGGRIAQLEGWSYLIPSESKHPREAYMFMEWAMSKDVQVRQTLRGGASSRMSTYSDPAVAKIPYVPVFLEAIPLGIPKPTIPESSKITELMQQGLSKIVTRQRTPEEGLDQIAVEIKAILGDRSRLRYPVSEKR